MSENHEKSVFSYGVTTSVFCRSLSYSAVYKDPANTTLLFLIGKYSYKKRENLFIFGQTERVTSERSVGHQATQNPMWTIVFIFQTVCLPFLVNLTYSRAWISLARWGKTGTNCTLLLICQTAVVSGTSVQLAQPFIIYHTLVVGMATFAHQAPSFPALKICKNRSLAYKKKRLIAIVLATSFFNSSFINGTRQKERNVVRKVT